MDKDIFNYDPLTGLLLGMGEADQDQEEEGNFLVPAYAALDEPPVPGANQAVVRRMPDGSVPQHGQGEWVVVPDYRSAVLYSTVDGSKVAAELGKTPAEMQATEVPMPDDHSKWDGLTWIPDPVKLAESARMERNRMLSVADVEINKAEDNGLSATALRTWRQKLRDWPASAGFPDLTTMPKP